MFCVKDSWVRKTLRNAHHIWNVKGHSESADTSGHVWINCCRREDFHMLSQKCRSLSRASNVQDACMFGSRKHLFRLHPKCSPVNVANECCQRNQDYQWWMRFQSSKYRTWDVPPKPNRIGMQVKEQLLICSTSLIRMFRRPSNISMYFREFRCPLCTRRYMSKFGLFISRFWLLRFNSIMFCMIHFEIHNCWRCRLKSTPYVELLSYASLAEVCPEHC